MMRAEDLQNRYQTWEVKNKKVKKLQIGVAILLVIAAVLLFFMALSFATPWGYGAGNIGDKAFVKKAFSMNNLLYQLSLYLVIITVISVFAGLMKRRKYHYVQYIMLGLILALSLTTVIYLVVSSQYVYPKIATLSEYELTRLFLTNQSSLKEVTFFQNLSYIISAIVLIVDGLAIAFCLLKEKHNKVYELIKNDIMNWSDKDEH